MNSVLVVVLAKGLQFAFKVMRVPEEQIIQELPTNHSSTRLPINRSMNGCDIGVYGMLLISSISKILKLAFHR